ncbi:MAG TPA: hypothetical protein VML94_03350 [Thermoplasmata archaeon]|nr:hypothetical protein [Thermoplasmata archaeon]
MGKRWLVGLVAAIAVVCMAGAGFSAFTAQAAVYGTANSATMDLQITDSATFGCFYFYNVPGAPGSIAVTGENAELTALTVVASNMTPSTYCYIGIALENTGSVAVNVSVALETAGAGGMCVADEVSCYGVFTYSGIGSDGTIYWVGAPNYGTPTYSNANFVTLSPGGTYIDYIGVDLPPGSTDASPASATFTVLYTATPGVPTGTPEGVFSGVPGA